MARLPEKHEDFVAAARALIPALRERAAETEDIRQIPDETVNDLHETGLFRILRSERFDGVTTPFRTMIDVVIELGRGCASTSWVYSNLVAHNWLLPYWPEQAEEDIWGENPKALIGSTLIFPAGSLEPTDGGYLFSGRWPYASGIDCSDWVMLGAMRRDSEDAKPVPLIVLIRASDLEVIDTWHVSGLAGTGSKDVACEKVFIPEHMVLNPALSKDGMTPGTEHLAPAYRMPILPFIPHFVAAPMVGVAQAAYEDFVAHLRTLTSNYNRSRLADHVTVQLKLAEAGQLVDIAALLVRADCDKAQSYADLSEQPPLIDRVRWRRNASHAAACCVKAVDLIHSVRGASANFLSDDLQRQFRDIHAAAHQIHLSWDINGAEFGRVAAGLPPNNPIV